MASTCTANSDFQKDSATSAIPQITEQVAAVLRRNTDRAFTLVDAGTGPGSSGLVLFATVINEVRRADSAREVTVVHQDLPGNAWGDLLTRLRQNPDSYLAADVRLDSAEVQPEPNPYRAQYEKDGDAAAYARAMVGFGRAFTESSVRRYLVHHSDPAADPRHAVDAVVDWIYAWCQHGCSADPDVHPLEAWTLTVIAHQT